MIDSRYSLGRRSAAAVADVSDARLRTWVDRGLFAEGRAGRGSPIAYTLPRCLDVAAARELADLGLPAQEVVGFVNRSAVYRDVLEDRTVIHIGRRFPDKPLQTVFDDFEGARVALPVGRLFVGVVQRFFWQALDQMRTQEDAAALRQAAEEYRAHLREQAPTVYAMTTEDR